MKGLEFGIVAIVLVCAGLAVTFYLTGNAQSGAVIVPQEFAAKQGVVEAQGEVEEGSSIAGRAYDAALFSAEKAVLSPQNAQGSASGIGLLFIAFVVVVCVLVWIRSR